MIECSIVIPCYNEENRLLESLEKIISFFKKELGKNNYEIIVVDDGSNDKTREIAKKFKVRLNKKRINMGKGFSVKEGVLMSSGKEVLITDCDLSTPIYEYFKLKKHLISFDVVIGSRALRDSKVKTRYFKKLFGILSNFVISFLFLNLNIKDTQCGFKLFKGNIARKLFEKSIIGRWGFDFEILFLVKKFNFKVKEVGVKWIEDRRSKVKLIDYPKTFLELVKVKYFNLVGYYDD